MTLSKLSLSLPLVLLVGCAESEDDLSELWDEVSTDYSANGTGETLYDVHGAGAQRSDPKTGDPGDHAGGHGPQADAVRIYNYARCVRSDSAVLPDTNQDACYGLGGEGEIDCPSEGEALHGQDGQLEGETPAYSVEGDVVVDEVTGLSWTASWYQASWDDRDASAAAIDDGGFDDWRVPTIHELYSIMDFSGATGTGSPESSAAPDDALPYLDDSAFEFEYPSGARYIDAQYLTSSEYASTDVVSPDMGDEQVFFGVNFADGRIKGYPLTGTGGSSAFYVRYVRGDGYGPSSYTDNGDATVTDVATGLVWMQQDSGGDDVAGDLDGFASEDGSLDWEEALAFCEDLELADADDWRLPDAKELQSLVDTSRSPDTTGSAAIDAVFEVTPIVDEEGEIDFPWYWSSTTHKDGVVEWEWAVYVAFGEAKGYGSDGAP